MLEHRIDQSFEVRYNYPVCFTRDAFDPVSVDGYTFAMITGPEGNAIGLLKPL